MLTPSATQRSPDESFDNPPCLALAAPAILPRLSLQPPPCRHPGRSPMDAPARSYPLEAPGRPHIPDPARRADPRLSVVIVNYRHWDDTARLVRQLRASTCLRRGRAEVVIVDNHSPAHPVV